MNQTDSLSLLEIMPLRLGMRSDVCLLEDQGNLFAEDTLDGRRFLLSPWQAEMMQRLNGERSFGDISSEVSERHAGKFSTDGLLNFYSWLEEENLLEREIDSLFELESESIFDLEGDAEEEVVVSGNHARVEAPMEAPESTGFGSILPSAADPNAEDFAEMIEEPGWFGVPWIDRLVGSKSLKIAAIVIFSLAVIRIAFVAAPIAEPAVKYAYTTVSEGSASNVSSEGKQGENEMLMTPVKEVELAGRVTEHQLGQLGQLGDGLEGDPVQGHAAIPEPETFVTVGHADLDRLRREIAECRIRRDEYYLQNNEIGYRYEVQKMTALAKQIGEIELKVRR